MADYLGCSRIAFSTLQEIQNELAVREKEVTDAGEHLPDRNGWFSQDTLNYAIQTMSNTELVYPTQGRKSHRVVLIGPTSGWGHWCVALKNESGQYIVKDTDCPERTISSYKSLRKIFEKNTFLVLLILSILNYSV